MASQRTAFRSLWIRQNSRRKQRANRLSGTSSTAAQLRRKPAQAMFPGVGGGLAALAIFACTFGPMPDASTMIDATIGREEVGTPRRAIDNILADSRRYLGL
jgi:hypothetical protein